MDWALGSAAFAGLAPKLRLDLTAARSVALRCTRGNGEDARTALHKALALAEAERALAYQIRLPQGFSIFAPRLADFKAAMAYAERRRAGVWPPLTDTGLATGDWMMGVLDRLMGRQAEARLRGGHARRGRGRTAGKVERSRRTSRPTPHWLGGDRIIQSST